MIVCFGENSPKWDWNWVKCCEWLRTAGSDFPEGRGWGGGGGAVCWIESRQLFVPLEDCSLICVYLPCRKGILNCELRIGTVLLLPVFTRGSPVWPGLCLYRHGGCKMSGKLGCVAECEVCEVSCGGTSGPSSTQGLANIATRENSGPRKKKSLTALSPFRSAADCASRTAFLLPARRGCC